MRLRILETVMSGLIVLLLCSTAVARLEYNVPRAVVLYDASRSMYPGYTIGEPANPRPPFFHEQAEFIGWLLSLLASQGERFGAGEMELAAFYNVGQQPNVRIDTLCRFNSSEEVRNLASTASGIERSRGFFQPVARAHANQEVGQRTYLLEALRKALGGWDGIIWLITDNIVEEGSDTDGSGSPRETDLDGLFYHLRDDPRYRSVHVFSYPYNIDGRRGALAVYGLLVSSDETDRDVLESLDSRFFDMRDVFAGGKHLKLRDLNISPLEFSSPLTVSPLKDDSYFGSEGHRLEIDHSATVTSNLTQHTVVSGAYSVSAGEFRPLEEASSAYGVVPLSSGLLAESQGELPVLPPQGTVDIAGSLSGQEAFRLKGMGVFSRLRWAFSGEPIKYKGDIHIHFSGLVLNFEPQHLDEIYGMSRAPAIFGINSGITRLADQQFTRHITIPVPPPAAPVWILLAVLLLALGGMGFVSWFLLRSSNYRITIGGDTTVVQLRPLACHEIRHDGLPIGRLSRLLTRDADFIPALPVEEQGNPPSWRVTLPSSGDERRVLPLGIESLGGGAVSLKTERKSGGGPSSLGGGERRISRPPPKRQPPQSR